MFRFSAYSVVAVAGVSLAGCGGKVLFAPTGGSGGAGDLTTSSTFSSSTTLTSASGVLTTTNTGIETGPSTVGVGGNSGTGGSGGSGSLCTQVCNLVQSCSTSQPDCSSQCAELYNGSCDGQANEYLDCVIASFANSNCGADESTCATQLNTVETCLSSTSTGDAPPGNCVSNGCSAGGDGGCECDGTCEGGAVSAICTPTAGGVSCECTFDKTTVGSCASSNNSNSCDLNLGCCAAFFAPKGD